MLGGDDVEQVEEVLQQHAVRPRQGGHEAGGSKQVQLTSAFPVFHYAGF